jgi:C1A family cysteine protease
MPFVKPIFEKWATKHGKNYSTVAEKTFRLEVFVKNYSKMIRINKSGKSYKAGINKFSDLTKEEFEAKYMGYIPSTKKYNNESVQESIEAPDSVDWRTKGIVAAVKNQEKCGSCWAFSAVAALEGAMAQSSGNLQTFSEQQLVDCSLWYGNHGCNGGLMDNAFRYVKAKGLTTEANYPYKAKEHKCDKAAVAKKVAHLHSHHDVIANDSKKLKEAAAIGVVSVAIQANDIQSYKEGIFDDFNCGTQLNHGVSIVGYGEEGKKMFWIVRNSWGATWGEQGYIRMIRTDHFGPAICGIAMKPSYPIISKKIE